MKALVQFAVGLNLKGKTLHEIVDADDALVAVGSPGTELEFAL